MFAPTMCHISGVTCHVSGVTCQVWCKNIYIFGGVKEVELVSGGSVINGAYKELIKTWIMFAYTIVSGTLH